MSRPVLSPPQSQDCILGTQQLTHNWSLQHPVIITTIYVDLFLCVCARNWCLFLVSGKKPLLRTMDSLNDYCVQSMTRVIHLATSTTDSYNFYLFIYQNSMLPIRPRLTLHLHI